MLELETDKFFNGKPLLLDKYLTTKLHDWPVEPELFSRGYSGLVYQGTNNQPFIIKIMFINVPIPEQYCKTKLSECWKKNYRDFRNELNLAKKFGKIGIGPEVYGAYEGTATCEFYENLGYNKVQVGIIIYEKYDETLHKFLSSKTSQTDRTRISTFLKFAFQQFDDLLIGAYDTHENNVMIKLNKKGSISKIAIIDFGEFSMTKNIKNKKQIIENNAEVLAKLEIDMHRAYQRN